MKKTSVITVLFFAVCFCSFSQIKSNKVTITWGEEQTKKKSERFEDIIGTIGENTFTIKALNKGKAPISIEKYGPEMELIKSAAVTLGEKKAKRNFQHAAEVDGELILFSTLLDKKSRVNILYAQTINKTTLLPSNKLTKIGAIHYEGSSKYNSGSFTYSISREEKKILIYYNLRYKRGENEQAFYHVYDKNLKLLWEKEISLPYESELFYVHDYEIDENGNLYLLSKIFKDKVKNERKGKPNYFFQIITYSNNGSKRTEYPVQLEGKFLTDMKIAINQEEDIICSGFYSENGTYSINGSYFLKIDTKSKSIESKSFKAFGIDFITQNMTDRQKEKTKKKEKKGKDIELFEYDLNDIILRDDGGAVLVGEQYFVKIYTTTDPQGNVYTTSHYYYNDIIVISINPTGEIEWTEKIAKRQHTVNDNGYFSSYAMTVTEDKLNFVFNDNVKNLVTSKMTSGKEKGQVYDFTKRFKSSVAVLVQVDSDGRQVKEALFNAKEAELLIRPKVCEQVSSNELVIYGQKSKTQRLGRITFK